MSEDNIDKIFKDGLNTTMKYANEELQWAKVQKRLKSSKRKYIIWLCFWGMSFITFLIFTFLIFKSTEGQEQAVILQTDQNQLTNTKKSTKSTLLSDSINALESSKNVNSNFDNSNSESLQKFKNNIANSKVMTPTMGTEKIEPVLDKTNYRKKIPNRNIKPIVKTKANSSIETKDSDKNNIYTHQLDNNKKDLKSIDYLIPINSIPLILSLIENNQNHLRIDNEIIKLVSRKENNNFGLSIELGVATDYLNSNLLSYTRDYSPYVKINFSFFDKATLSVGYNSQKINRNIGQNFLTYNVPQLYNPYQPEIPDIINLQYSNKNIDINFNYKIWNTRLFKVSLGIGSQVNKNEKQDLVYIYENQYSSFREEQTGEQQNWHFSDVTMGVNIEFPINKRISVSNQYQYHIPLESNNFQWPKRFRIMLGIQYKLKI